MAVSQADLDHVLSHLGDDLLELRNARMFITGGTGYVGRWLLEALLHANRARSLGLTLTVLSRDPSRFQATHSHLCGKEIVSFVTGDVRDFAYPSGSFTHAIHAATDVVTATTHLETFDVTVTGTRHTLNFCAQAGVHNVLLLSSGAVYGAIPANVITVPEEYGGAPDPNDLAAAYGLGKRVTEWLGTLFSQEAGLACKSARVFAQVGPYLALDRQFAAGNFIRDAILRQPIVIRGDGTPLRSYMYAADMVVWLLRILLRGRAYRAYNVGSDQAISIFRLAEAVAAAADWDTPAIDVQGRAQSDVQPERYVPSIERAREELGLTISIPLEEALSRTVEWYRPRLLGQQKR